LELRVFEGSNFKEEEKAQFEGKELGKVQPINSIN